MFTIQEITQTVAQKIKYMCNMVSFYFLYHANEYDYVGISLVNS